MVYYLNTFLNTNGLALLNECFNQAQCSSGACTSGSGTQSFQLKTTAAIGDPADGGVIACMNGGLNNLVAPTTDNRESTIVWGGVGTAIGLGAQSNNTTASGQLYCLYTNRDAISGFASETYWSSTEASVNSSAVAWIYHFGANDQNISGKNDARRVRCVQAFVP